MKVWGIGVVQNFSAAATDLYLGDRHFDGDIKCTDAVALQPAQAAWLQVLHRSPTSWRPKAST